MYNSAEEIPEYILNLPLKDLIVLSKRWKNIRRDSLMKKRRKIKNRLYAQAHRNRTINIRNILLEENCELQQQIIKLIEDKIDKIDNIYNINIEDVLQGS